MKIKSGGTQGEKSNRSDLGSNFRLDGSHIGALLQSHPPARTSDPSNAPSDYDSQRSRSTTRPLRFVAKKASRAAHTANIQTYCYPVIIFDGVALYSRTGDVGQTFRIRLNSACVAADYFSTSANVPSEYNS